MEKLVHTFKINLDWQLVNLISRIDRFDSSWSSIEKRECQSLKQLKSISTVRSVGASTRIEGSEMSDEEVEILLREVDIRKLEDRDSQEVVGYYEALELISEAFGNLMITEGELKNLHNIMMKYSEKDQWHKGQYKQHNNSVEATLPDGTKQILLKTTEAGYQTNEAMKQLIDWYKGDNQTHPLVKSVLFAYEFVSIHPFQDGNGRLSRLVTTLLLLKNGYNWIQYVSLEHEIESRKAEYYRVLMGCQMQRPNEDVSDWVKFILDALLKTQDSLMQKLDTVGMKNRLSPKEKSLVTYIADHPGCKSGEIAKNLGIPNPTVKRILPILVEKNLIERFGTGPGTYYTIK